MEEGGSTQHFGLILILISDSGILSAGSTLPLPTTQSNLDPQAI
jgi:hypothetical protein